MSHQEVSLNKEKLVLTPGGVRPKSNVHLIEPGYSLHLNEGKLQKIGPSGRVKEDFDLAMHPPEDASVRLDEAIPESSDELGPGWIAWAEWDNDTGNPITYFSTTWVVPPPPEAKSDQLIYLFNGLQNPDRTWILQPVLQWGVSDIGGGDFWGIGSWFVERGGHACSSQLIPVNPGDVLYGIISVGYQSEDLIQYKCEFRGFAQTCLWTTFNELTSCCQALEVYSPGKRCRSPDYPNTPFTSFQAIDIKTGTINPKVSWSPKVIETNSRQRAEVANKANPGGEVIIYYR